jgi:hypothetical protein
MYLPVRNHKLNFSAHVVHILYLTQHLFAVILGNSGKFFIIALVYVNPQLQFVCVKHLTLERSRFYTWILHLVP